MSLLKWVRCDGHWWMLMGWVFIKTFLARPQSLKHSENATILTLEGRDLHHCHSPWCHHSWWLRRALHPVSSESGSLQDLHKVDKTSRHHKMKTSGPQSAFCNLPLWTAARGQVSPSILHRSDWSSQAPPLHQGMVCLKGTDPPLHRYFKQKRCFL